MPTNEERKNVAAICRKLASMGADFSGGSISVVVGVRPLFNVECWNKLADLIDPEPSEGPTSCDKALTCDRERLLAIATVMAADSVRSAKQGSSVSPVYILLAARNIAEACGETFGSIRDQELAKWGTSIVPKETVVDRDALLSLADDIDKQTDGSMFDALLEDGHYIARRIREAVGA